MLKCPFGLIFVMQEVHYLFVLLLEVRAEEGEHQERSPKTEAPLVGLTKAPIILLHWLGWRACFELVFELVWVTRPRPLGQVVLLALSSDRPTEFRSLASVPGDHPCSQRQCKHHLRTAPQLKMTYKADETWQRQNEVSLSSNKPSSKSDSRLHENNQVARPIT